MRALDIGKPPPSYLFLDRRLERKISDTPGRDVLNPIGGQRSTDEFGATFGNFTSKLGIGQHKPIAVPIVSEIQFPAAPPLEAQLSPAMHKTI